MNDPTVPTSWRAPAVQLHWRPHDRLRRCELDYDAATGFGSFDITSFVTNYAPLAPQPSTVALTIVDPADGHCAGVHQWRRHYPELHHTQHVASNLRSRQALPPAAGTPTGDVDIFTPAPSRRSTSVGTLTLSWWYGEQHLGTCCPVAPTTSMPAMPATVPTPPSVGAGNPATLTVKPEACQMVVYGHNINIGSTTNIAYGTPISITVEPYSAVNTNNVGIPSGSINVTDFAR